MINIGLSIFVISLQHNKIIILVHLAVTQARTEPLVLNF
jgi:hypothetical protein